MEFSPKCNIFRGSCYGPPTEKDLFEQAETVIDAISDNKNEDYAKLDMAKNIHQAYTYTYFIDIPNI